MVQEYVSPVRVHKYPFEMVMAAYERRFPNCPQIPVVVECVVTEDSWSSDNSQRNTTRRCQLNVDAPYLLKKMIGVDYIYFIQKNHLDLKNRVLEIDATNETFASRVSVLEKCKYFVHPENPEWTCFEQSALLDVKNFFGLENTVEKIAMKQYAANIAKGKELIESFMKEVHADNIRELKPWAAGDVTHNAYLRSVVSQGAEPTSHPAPEARTISQPGSHHPDGGSCSSPDSLSLRGSRTKLSSPSWHRDKGSSSYLHHQQASTSKSPSVHSHSNSNIQSHQNKSALRLAKSSKQNQTNSRSKIKLLSPSSSKKQLDRKWTKILSRTRLKKDEPSTSNENIRESASFHKLRELAHQEIRESEREKILDSVNKPNIMNEDSTKKGYLDFTPKEVKPCHCESRTITLGYLFARTDNIMIVVAVALAILLVLGAPISFVMNRWH